MNAKLAALQRLHDAVVEGDNFGIIPLGQEAFGPADDYSCARGYMVSVAYAGSLDAAKALHDAMLPDHLWDFWRGVGSDGVRYYGCNLPGVDTAYSADPARSWLIAIIKALMAQEGE